MNRLVPAEYSPLRYSPVSVCNLNLQLTGLRWPVRQAWADVPDLASHQAIAATGGLG